VESNLAQDRVANSQEEKYGLKYVMHIPRKRVESLDIKDVSTSF
jgi:hypothetical protein